MNAEAIVTVILAVVGGLAGAGRMMSPRLKRIAEAVDGPGDDPSLRELVITAAKHSEAAAQSAAAAAQAMNQVRHDVQQVEGRLMERITHMETSTARDMGDVRGQLHQLSERVGKVEDRVQTSAQGARKEEA